MKFDQFFTDITRLVMTLLLVGGLGTLLTAMHVACDPDAALSAYHSVGPMAEHILAGSAAYLALSVICAKIRSSLHDTGET
ncbi:MAG: hypothetical protein IJ037_14455 [Clostridia bacterium]|nr:hypothetical protein [Clostridia bacterium]MBQ8369013.1 hypothetical protein [Clostridia bacterium]